MSLICWENVLLSGHKLTVSLMIAARVHCNETTLDTSEMDRTGKWISLLQQFFINMNYICIYSPF